MKRALRITAWIAGGLAAAVLLVVLIGVFLPVRHTATVERELAASPDEVWAVITGVEQFPEWRPGVDRAERLEPIQGWPAWREDGPDGPITFTIAALEPRRRLVTEIVDEGLPFGGRWTYLLEPVGAGTRMTITEDGFIYSPVYRFVSRFFIGYEGTAQTYLDALAARVGG
jgi:uncharacterized protein YndB with AHSA1/START domain